VEAEQKPGPTRDPLQGDTGKGAKTAKPRGDANLSQGRRPEREENRTARERKPRFDLEEKEPKGTCKDRKELKGTH
jgi:hypothetical protein